MIIKCFCLFDDGVCMFVFFVICLFCGFVWVYFFVECYFCRLGLLMFSCGCCVDFMLVFFCNLVCRLGIWYEMKCRFFLNFDFLSVWFCIEYCLWFWIRMRLIFLNWILGEGWIWFNIFIFLIFFISFNYVFWLVME